MYYRMTRFFQNIVFLLFLSLLTASSSFGQWRIPTPRQTLSVPSDGSKILFPNVSLPVGMTYHIHADGRAQVSNSGDIADACYYVNIISLSPYVVPVAMKVRSSATQEQWMYDLLSPQNYHSNHIYDASLASAGSPLTLRFFDRADPPNAYYGDNSGSITVEVAQQTPEIVAKIDTVNFGSVLVGKSKTMLDSVASYGTDGYRCDNVAMLGPSAAKFNAFSQGSVPFGIQESTNEFQFTYLPTVVGPDTAYFHLYSANVYAPQRDFVIMLIGNGVGTQLSVNPDTLDFGAIRVNTTKKLTAMIRNAGPSTVTVTSIAVAPATPFSSVPAPIVVNGRDSAGCDVTFAPTTQGSFLATFTCSADDGSTLKFYAKGTAGVPIAYVSDSVLVFGRLLLNGSKTLTDTILNKGNIALEIVSTVNSNPFEYTVTGAQGPHTYAAGSGAYYGFTFTARNHIPFWGNHDGSFTYNFVDGTSKTIVFKGCDHAPISTRLRIDTNYFVTPGNTVEVKQEMLDQLDSSYSPIRALKERISFDQTTFDFVSARKGTMTNTPNWNLTATAGIGYVDVSLTATTDHLGAPGTVVLLTFRAHTDAVLGQQTLLPQLNVDFSNNFEPVWTSSSGRIIVGDLCTPVRLSQLTTPKASYIEQNIPNPVERSATIGYSVGPGQSTDLQPVRIRLFDEMGRLVKTLVDEVKQPGRYDVTIGAEELPPGIYWYVFEAGGVWQQRSMIVTR